MAGWRTAPGGYCLARCYCGACPHYVPIGRRATNTPDVFTEFDRRAIATGQRRSRPVDSARVSGEVSAAAGLIVEAVERPRFLHGWDLDEIRRAHGL